MRKAPLLSPVLLLLVAVAFPRLFLRQLRGSNTTALNLGRNARSTPQEEGASFLSCPHPKLPQLALVAAPGLAGTAVAAVAAAAARHTDPAARTIPAAVRSTSKLVQHQGHLQMMKPHQRGSKAMRLPRKPKGILAASFSTRLL